MNKQRLQDIANHTQFVIDNDIVEIKQLIGLYPFYSLPHIVLAKIFFEKEHYLFENALTQAAMRVNDREWLYQYINGDKQFDFVASIEQTTVSEEMVEVSESIPIEVSESDNHRSEETLEVQKVNEDFILDENLIQSVIKNDITEFLEVQLNNTEIVNSKEEIKLQVPETAKSIILVEENADIRSTEEIIDSETKESENENIVSDQTALPSTLNLNVALNLRKHPVYNVEDFLQTEEHTKEIPTSEEKDFFYWLKHPQKEETFIKQEELQPLEKDNKINIIDQFIMANPGISRPKKEFFNAENMAKKSEYLDIEFVTETLANIYYEQGNIDLAVNAYEKLSLQNPLKQAYFASLIEKIKKEKR